MNIDRQNFNLIEDFKKVRYLADNHKILQKPFLIPFLADKFSQIKYWQTNLVSKI